MSHWRDWDWDYKKDVIEDHWRRATPKQIKYIQQLYSDLGTPNDADFRLLSEKEAAALIHDLHLEWLGEQG